MELFDRDQILGMSGGQPSGWQPDAPQPDRLGDTGTGYRLPPVDPSAASDPRSGYFAAPTARNEDVSGRAESRRRSGLSSAFGTRSGGGLGGSSSFAGSSAGVSSGGGFGGGAVATESTPIFDELVSAWFRKGSSLAFTDLAAEASQPLAGRSGGEPAMSGGPAWRTAADEGWQAADAAAHSEPESFTTAGLPRRNPQALLLPGSIGGRDNEERRPVERRPDEMRERLNSFRRGSSEGRHNVETKRWRPVWNDSEDD